MIKSQLKLAQQPDLTRGQRLDLMNLLQHIDSVVTQYIHFSDPADLEDLKRYLIRIPKWLYPTVAEELADIEGT